MLILLLSAMQELEFERGLWQAAKDGDMERVRRLLDRGSGVNDTDSAGYTPLVGG